MIGRVICCDPVSKIGAHFPGQAGGTNMDPKLLNIQESDTILCLRLGHFTR
jgi:hypothetical protein